MAEIRDIVSFFGNEEQLQSFLYQTALKTPSVVDKKLRLIHASEENTLYCVNFGQPNWRDDLPETFQLAIFYNCAPNDEDWDWFIEKGIDIKIVKG